MCSGTAPYTTPATAADEGSVINRWDDYLSAIEQYQTSYVSQPATGTAPVLGQVKDQFLRCGTNDSKGTNVV